MVTTRTRLETASAKLQQARDEGSDLVDALQLGVDKTRAKLEAAERALQAFASREGSAPQAGEPADAAAAAIARALAARAQAVAMDPAEKARSQLEGLEQRLEKTRARLAQGRSSGEEEKIIVALEATLARLEQQVSATRDQLTAMERS